MMFDRRLLLNFDFSLYFFACALALLGVFGIYSTASSPATLFKKVFYLKQLLWFAIGSGALFLVSTLNYRTVARFAYPFYGLSIFGLFLVDLFGKQGLGAQRWLQLGSLTLQPSEFVKLALILALARYFDDHKEELGKYKTFLVPSLMTMAPMALVIKQPDLGTAFLLLFISITLFSLVGLRPRHLLYLIAGGLLSAPLLWSILKSYQRQRILVFLNPNLDPLGAGYHITQSKIAVGSGGFWGKGFLATSQSQLNFLPESHTDFIFAVLAEQWGFLGSILILILYLALISRALDIAKEAKDVLAFILSIGIVSMITLQVVINVGMVMGIMPVVGIPLPLMSYGGSSMLATMMAIGLLLGIRMRRFLY
ncbi:MAG: rod shape-determining protein RodA [candidate division NC10 bacterium]|nr:rod shape-determining protein RodA [candidate division NC10 bacterium]